VVGELDGESSVGYLVESEGSVERSPSSNGSSEVLPNPLLLWLVLAVVPSEDSILSGGPTVWGQAPLSHSQVLSLSEDLLVSSASVGREGGVASKSGSVVVLASDDVVSLLSVSEGSSSGVISEVRSPVASVGGKLGNPVVVSLLVSGHPDGESAVSNLEQSEGSASSASSDDHGSAGSEVSPKPLLVVVVLAVIPGQDSVLSGGPAMWGQAPSAHSQVVAMSVDLLVSSASVDGEGGVSSKSSSVVDLSSDGKLSVSSVSQGSGSAIIVEVSSPAASAGGQLGDVVLVSLLVSRHPDGESSVGDLVESEGSQSSSDPSSSSDDGDSSGLEVSPDPLLLWLVLAVVPSEDAVLSGGPTVWGQAPS